MLVWQFVFFFAWIFVHVQGLPIIDVFGEGVTLTASNFSLTSHGAWLVEFFSPSCPHCRNFAPTWNKATKDLEPLRDDKEAPYTLARVNCIEWMDLCLEQKVDFFPDAKQYFDGQLDIADVLRLTGHDAEKIEAFVKEQQKAYRSKKLGLPASSATTPTNDAVSTSVSSLPAVETFASSQNTSSHATSNLAPLSSLTEFGTAPLETIDRLDAYLGPDVGQGPSFVKFYSPSCPHCNAMAAAYMEAAKVMEGQVNPIAVNCLKYMDVCTKYGINGWPTMHLYKNGTKTDYPMHGPRTKELFLAFLREQGVLHIIETVNAAFLDTALARQKYSVLYYMPGSASERSMIEEVRMSVSSPMAFFVSDDPAIAPRIMGGGPSLFVFQGALSNLVASLPLSSVAGQLHNTAVSAIAQWLDLQAQPSVVELSASGLDSAFLQSAGIVMAVLSSDSKDVDAQLQAFTKLAHAWRSSPDLSHKHYLFAWLDHERYPQLLLSRYRIHVSSTPTWFVIDGPSNLMYQPPMKGSWLDPSEHLLWLTSVSQGHEHGQKFGTVLTRTWTSVRVAGTPFILSHPLLLLVVFMTLLLLIPRTRRMLLQYVPRSHASTKMV
ncbi:protein disulfide-isomerase [Malassezia nana]|uniref:Protein disulfide-isomerase n=1 Tax=Malassezia nana TaxID=180528 RepID=A0AAF0EP88_9BASI|nr:protein disulfide-isomerase [Malassezia nana]